MKKELQFCSDDFLTTDQLSIHHGKYREYYLYGCLEI